MRRIRLALALVGPLVSSLPAPAQQVAGGFVSQHWTVADGLPVDSINSMLQSKDGYLWLATFDGLVRFDGVRFTVVGAADLAALPSNRWTYVVEAPDGSLWAATEQHHLVRFKGSQVTRYSESRGLPGRRLILLVREGDHVWIGTDHGLARVDGDRLRRVAPDRVQGIVSSFAPGRDGDIWVGVGGRGLYRVGPQEQVDVYGPAEGLVDPRVDALLVDRDGTVWAGTPSGLFHVHDGRVERTLAAGAPWTRQVFFIQQDRDGTLWLGTDRGTFFLRDGDIQPFRPEPDPGLMWAPPLRRGPDGHRWLLTGRRVYREDTLVFESKVPIRSLTFDREGSLWIAPVGDGLYRVRPAACRGIGKTEGLPSENIYPILEDRDGTIWLGTLDAGLVHLNHGQIEAYGTDSGLTAGFVWSLALRGEGGLWVGGSGLCHFEAGRCSTEGVDPRLLRERAVRAIHEDREGRLWVGTEDGLYLRQAGQWRRLGRADGLPHESVRVFHEDPAGRIWMGTNGGGLAIYQADRFSTLGVAQGLSSNLVRAIAQDADGVLWIGTENAGLCRIELQGGSLSNPSIVSIRKRDGLFDDVIHQILQDDRGRLWMNTNRGLFWVHRRDLNAFARGQVQKIQSVGYTERDGLRRREGNGGVQPAGIRASDGRLWFPTQGGAAVVDPDAIAENPVPPPVLIEGLRVAGRERPVQPGESVQLSAGERDLELGYTALSFVDPAKVLFRYRLWGYDQDWIQAGTRRAAFYTNVPPGRYRFQVLACNNSGRWNELGASLELAIAPRFYETRTFEVLAGLLLVLMGVGVARLRVQRLISRRVELERLVADSNPRAGGRKAPHGTRPGQGGRAGRRADEARRRKIAVLRERQPRTAHAADRAPRPAARGAPRRLRDAVARSAGAVAAHGTQRAAPVRPGQPDPRSPEAPGRSPPARPAASGPGRLRPPAGCVLRVPGPKQKPATDVSTRGRPCRAGLRPRSDREGPGQPDRQRREVHTRRRFGRCLRPRIG